MTEIKPITDEVIIAMKENLIEFGYSGLEDTHVKEEVRKLKAGEHLGIIGLFAQDMLIKNGYWEKE